MSSIVLVPIGNVPDVLLQRLVRSICEVFHTMVSLSKLTSEPSVAFDPYRNQYNSTMLLSILLNSTGTPGTKILGVTEYDLFVPVLTYVFGEAQLNGNAAVVSFFRLRPELYGLPMDAAIVESRLEKEAIHELGHTFGLIHCSDDHCVMHPSTYAEEIDLKSHTPCSDCLVELHSRFGVVTQSSRTEGTQSQQTSS